MQKLTIIILSLVLFSCKGEVPSEFEIEKGDIVKTDCSVEIPEDFFIVDTLTTDAGSMIYWQFNQDSSWLNFEEVNGHKTVLNSMYCGMMDYSYKLGMQRFGVYPKYAVFYHEWISGCCTPPDIRFFDIHEPKEIKRINSHSFIRLNGDHDFCIYFNDSTLNTATFLELQSDKSTIITFPKGLLKSKFEPSGHMFPREFFNDVELKDKNLKIAYQYKNDHSDWIRDSIMVNMKK